MNCRRARKLIFEFVDGLSNEKVQLELELHLGECPECDTLASQLTQSLDLVHRAPQEELDENFNWNVRLAIHKERNAIQERAASQGSLFRDWNFRYAASAVSGFAVILVAGWIAINAGLTSVPVSEPFKSDVLSEAASNESAVARQEMDAVPEAPKRESTVVEKRSAPRSAVAGNSPLTVVADGLAQSPSEQRAGAIDLVGNTAEMDSLVHLETRGMSEDDRVLYFEKRIEQLQIHLEKCKRADHR